jgi:hypothetical protein
MSSVRVTYKILLFLLFILLVVFIYLKYTGNFYKKQSVTKNENYYNAIFCESINGETETKHYYDDGFVIADCENDKYIIEAGLDKRSSLDSVQQAIFFSILSKKKPMIVIYDTDGKKSKYEIQIEAVTKRLNIDFEIIKVD